jgi:hypothetical protein
MTLPIHVSDESTPRARGVAFGRAQSARVRHTIAVYRRLCDLSAGGRVRASDDEHEELAGIAARLEVVRTLPLLQALHSHDGHPKGVCRHVDESEPWEERTATLASVIMDLAARRLHVAGGQPCTTPHVEVELSTPAASRSSLSV